MNGKTLLLLVVIAGLCFSACRPRTSRNNRTPARNTNAAAQQRAATQAAGPSAREVLNRTDSAIARVASLGEDRPPVAVMEPVYMPPMGTPYVPAPNLSEYGRFEAGLAAFNGGQYDQAIGNFSQTVVSGRPPELVPNAYYWIGESYYAMQRYSEALPYFEYVSKVGPQDKREMALYKLSRSNVHLGNQQASNLWYQRLSAEYPKSKYRSTLRSLGAR